jgi:hypothetical protein
VGVASLSTTLRIFPTYINRKIVHNLVRITTRITDHMSFLSEVAKRAMPSEKAVQLGLPSDMGNVPLIKDVIDLFKSSPKEPLPNIPGSHPREISGSSGLMRLDELNAGAGTLTNRAEELENIFATKRFTASPFRRDSNGGKINVGYFEDDAGKPIHAVVRDARVAGNELKTYELKKESPFSTGFPVTVEREGYIVQERVGKSLFDRLGMLAKRAPELEQQQLMLNRILGSDALAPRLFEEAAVERAILGASDDHIGNYAATIRQARLKISNIDMEDAYDSHLVPDKSKLPFLHGRQISDDTLGTVDEFLTKFSSLEGFLKMRSIGFTSNETGAMLARAKWHLDNKAFRGLNDNPNLRISGIHDLLPKF